MNHTEFVANWKVLSMAINDRVYIPDEDVYGVIVNLGAFASMVRYNVGGIEYEVLMLNEDFTILGEE